MNDLIELKKQLEEAVKREGIDLIGFAPKSRFDGVPAQNNPFSISPKARPSFCWASASAAAPCATSRKAAISAITTCSAERGSKTSSFQ